LPLDQDDGEDAQEFYASKGNSSDRNIYSTPLGARPKPQMVQIPPKYDKNKHSNQNCRPDYLQQTSTLTTNGPRRYSCKLGNIPGTLRNSDKTQAATLVFHGDETRDSRLAALTTLGKDRIHEQRHQNVGSVTEEAQLDPICFLVWLESFVKHCFSKNIYCPSILSYLPKSYMGREWDSGNGIPYTNVTGKKVDHSLARIFRCPLTVLKNGVRPALDDHSRHGRFAVYSGTMKKILCFPKGKTAPLESTHVIFDELYSLYKVEPPVVQELRKAMEREMATLKANARCNPGVHDTFDIISESEQFARIKTVDISTSGDKSLGLVIEINLPMNRGYISDVVPNYLASHIKNWRTELIGSFVTRVNDNLVFTASKITQQSKKQWRIILSP